MTKAPSWSGGGAMVREPGKAAVLLLSIFALAGLGLSFTFRAAEWRAEHVLMSRYCDDPEKHVALIRRLLTQKEPVDHQGRRAHMIAAKLLFVVPRAQDEPVAAYVDRLRSRIEETCG
ncbi:MAG: hypothetical protein ACR2PO_15425 [Methyloligellaceae bacterium]